MTENLDPATLPQGTLAVIAIGNVENIKAFKTSNTRWTYAENEEVGLSGTYTTNKNIQVQRVLTENEEVIPRRRPYDVEGMSGRQLEDALIETLGEGQEQGYEYYGDYEAIDAFWHLLAGTQTLHDPSAKWSSGQIKSVPTAMTVVKDGTIDVSGLGRFTRVEKNSLYNESGDLDEELVFEFNGRHFQKNGALDSWEGGLWDGGLFEVKPVEVKVTEWQKV